MSLWEIKIEKRIKIALIFLAVLIMLSVIVMCYDKHINPPVLQIKIDQDAIFVGEKKITYGKQTYKTVKIGTQTWFAENLNYGTEGSICYNNNPANCAKYGRLYNWQVANKVCPEGWHLPSNAEWDKLYRFVDGDKGTESPYRSPTAGKHLKAAIGWNEDGNGTDKYGFSASPGGYGNSDGSFVNVGDNGYWWSAIENESYSYGANYRNMNYNNLNADWYSNYKFTLFSVRCVQDGDEKSSSSVSSSSSFAYSGKGNDISNYRTAVIGTQTWMAENLDYVVEGSVCYDNNPDNCAKYGRLYNWEMAMKVCPKGWHLPSNEDWKKLFRFVDGDTGSVSPYESPTVDKQTNAWAVVNPYKSPTAGKHLKAAIGWNEDGNGTDKHGFSALPGGCGSSDGSFYHVGEHGFWWSASEKDSNVAYFCNMYYGYDQVVCDEYRKSILFSYVRCLRD
jgi:uncharacterized protein (TIGR02145 family)